MGYRSQVVLVVGKEALPLFLKALATNEEARQLCYSHADERVDKYGDENDGVLFYWDHVKWYDSYEDIKSLVDFMDECDSVNDMDDHYRFVRTGEEIDDNEVRGYGFDHVCVTRSVEY